MTKRDIYNYDGVKVGELELPNETTEEQWAEKLAAYASPPIVNFADVTPRQIRQALVLSGVSLSQIDEALAGLPEPMKTLATIEWQYSVAFIRANPLVAQVGQSLGWTSAQVDALWTLAKNL
jgi:hypothetical protein